MSATFPGYVHAYFWDSHILKEIFVSGKVEFPRGSLIPSEEVESPNVAEPN